VVHGDHDPLARQDGDLAAGKLGDLPRPGPRRVDDDLRPDPKLLPGQLVLHQRADDRVAVAFDVEHAMVGEDLGAVLPRRPGASRDELPGVEARVGNGEGPRDRRVEAGFHAQRLRDGDLLEQNAGLAATLRELVAEGRIVPLRRHEQAAGVLDAVGRDAAQDGVLPHALHCRDRVLHRVPPARVEETVEAAGRPDGQVASLHQNRREAAHRGVADDAGPGRAAADDEHFRLQSRHATSQYRSAPWGERAGGLESAEGSGPRSPSPRLRPS
jgi:hypothetical protein